MTDISNPETSPHVTQWVDEPPSRGPTGRRSTKYDAVAAEIRAAGPGHSQWAEIEVGANTNNQASTRAGALNKTYPDIEFCSRGNKVYARIKDENTAVA